jgi:putative holliday junction resolvase
MKIMGMDIGDRYIGIALTDREKKMSVPLVVLENDAGFKDRFCSIMDREGVEKIVVGMPYTLRGEIGQQGKKVLEFVNKKILDTGIEVVYQDERFTSKLHLEPGVKNKKGKGRKDKFSAALILQGYLDRTSAIRRDDDE